MANRAGVIVKAPGGIIVGHPTGHPVDAWDIFKGHIDSWESTVDCAIRELQEESGIAISKEDLRYIGSLHYEEGRLVLFEYCCESIDLSGLRCSSLIDQGKREGQPEMDGFRYMSENTVMERYNGSLRL